MDRQYTRRSHGLLVAASAAFAVSLASGGHALAQAASGLSPQEVEQLRAELKAVRAEAQAAHAQEAAREQKIDELQRRLDTATGAPPTPPIATIEPAQQGAKAARAEGGPNFEIYGFAQVDYTQDFNRVNPAWEDALRPSRLPTFKGEFGENGQSSISAKQSRFGVQASQDIAGQPLFVKFEFDLFGVGADEGQTTMRLRHFYGQWGPILGGQTNTNWMDVDIFPNTMEYWGPPGMVFLRNPQIRYTYKTGGNELAVAIEKPGNDVDAGNIREFDPNLGNSIQGSEKIPDLTAHWRYNGDWGHIQLGGILRQVGFDTAGTPDNQPKGHKTGWGLNLTGNIKTWQKDVLHLGIVYGEGIATYMNDGGVDLGPKANVFVPVVGGPPVVTLAPDVLPLTGALIYYDHYWNDRWSTALGWSVTHVDNLNFQEATAFQTGQYASVNLLWTPEKHILAGAEYIWGQREGRDGFHSQDNRVQFSFKYSFSSNDFR
ncbi:MAG TPA: DcaP family trimeric outer membrane transporter [Phenylobacterium sp.]|nr:DcaP family trimeric outer membrane transporter [Phenylobacterium sp.]